MVELGSRYGCCNPTEVKVNSLLIVVQDVKVLHEPAMPLHDSPGDLDKATVNVGLAESKT